MAARPDSEPLARLAGVSTLRGGRAVLRGLDLSLRRGELYGLLGPNGSGKSTTLDVLAQLLPVDAGQLLFDGRPPGPDARRRVGLCPQQPALYDALRPAENLAFFASLYGLRGAAGSQRVAEVMQQCGLEPQAGTRAGRLSGGWRQRLNLAVALVHRPDLLLLDEPTSALDLQARQALWPILRQRCEAGTALLLATHDMAEAGRLCTRIGLLDAGRIVAEGTPAELVARVPGSAIATLHTLDAAAAEARAAHCGWPVRHWDEGLSMLLPAGVGLRDVVEALAGLDIRAVGVQPVALAHAYLELTQAGSQRVQLAMLGAP